MITWKSLVFLEAAQSGLVLPKNINFIPFAYDSRHIEDRVSNVCGLYMLVRYLSRFFDCLAHETACMDFPLRISCHRHTYQDFQKP